MIKIMSKQRISELPAYLQKYQQISMPKEKVVFRSRISTIFACNPIVRYLGHLHQPVPFGKNL